MENIIKELQNELRTRFFMDGENHPKISAVKVYRFTDERIEMPQTDNPYLYIVLDGMLRLYTPSGIMDYMAGQFSVMNHQTVPSEFIRKNIMQEITYYVLCGSCGKQFIQSIAGIGQAEKIYQANS